MRNPASLDFHSAPKGGDPRLSRWCPARGQVGSCFAALSHADLGQPDLAALRPAAGDAEFAETEARLLDSYRYRLGGADPLAPLARDIAGSLIEAGLTLH